MSELNFKGKEFVYNHHLSVPFRPLVMDAGKGIGDPSLDGNLIVHGDNLHALKALLPLYAGKVKCVYIDPPYNTGKEGWAYNDNVNSPLMREWLGQVVDRDDLTRHDKWCCMMMPRLKLLRELLREDGVIFVSIDDNEVHHLRCLMDEVFGEENFFATLSRRAMHTVRNSSQDFNQNTDYVLAYARRKEWFGADKSRYIRQMVDKAGSYPHHDDDGRGNYKLDPIHARNFYTPYTFTFRNGMVWEAPSGSYPRYSPETLERLEGAGRIVFGAKEPMAKRYLAEVQEGQPPDTFLKPVEVGFNKDGTGELGEIFGSGGVFSQPKPTKLIRFLVRLLRDPDAIILDSFAGSGTTAHAVLAQNREDGGNRRFILVECEDYADRVTAERIRRVINGYTSSGTQKTELMREKITWRTLRGCQGLLESVEAFYTLHGHEYDQIRKQVKKGELVVTGEKAVAEQAEGLGGSFTYCTLGEPVELDRLLTGEKLPPWDGLGAVLFHMATNRPLNPNAAKESDGYLGVADGQHVWLIYKDDLDWLKSPEAALTLTRARAFASADPEHRHLVFAPARYVSQKMLDDEGIPVEFVPLPFALYRIDRS